MITKAVKTLMKKVKRTDPELAQVMQAVSKTDSRANCIYFDRHTLVVSGHTKKKRTK